MDNFEVVYRGLNRAQKQAVDAVDGPVLVIAGPGTGKTQLLSARVAQILRKTDTLPENILCLTFTESGAQNMRERLTRFIGKAAYDVQIGTYHAFGGDLIRRYPEYFTETRMERPVDDLGKRQILSDIIDKLSYRSPLKQTRHHLGDLMATMSEVKRGLLTPEALRELAESNQQAVAQASSAVGEILADHTKRLPAKLAVAEPLFQKLSGVFKDLPMPQLRHSSFQTLNVLAAEALQLALDEAAELGKTTPLTKWKNSWLAKDEKNQYILAGSLEAKRMTELADVLAAYTAELEQRGLYDFDDMILRSIQVLAANDDLKFSLQERYQYILLDEFQDTNAAQLKLVELLTDNPANEERPNVLAVGDDDQAIYSFQGAQYSNMLDYFHLFRDVLVINLSENYRSTAEILAAARNVAGQINDTLAATFSDLDKSLVAANHTLPKTTMERLEYPSDVAERAAIAAQIKSLIASGVAPHEIAVLAPKHRYLEPLVPHLADIPLRYERRENILQAPVIRQLLTMSKLVLALNKRQFALADSYWPEVLSYDFWDFPVSSIWQLAWQAGSQRKSWSELLLQHETFRPAALLFLTLAGQVETETLEVLLDRLSGTEEVKTGEADLPTVRSPLRNELLVSGASAKLYQTATELTVLRARLHDHQQQQGSALNLADLMSFVAAYEAADQQLINTSPYNEAADAVQMLTVFKAKGLEFEHVFLLACQDDVWGSTSRGNANKLTLPANLAPIRHAGSTEDERLRLFFVAITRAKHGLYLTSHRATYAGKQTPRLKYLAEAEADDASIAGTTLPAPFNVVKQSDETIPPIEALEANWQQRHTSFDAPLEALLHDRLASYQLSPTHLTSFIDLEHAGPQSFLLQTLLRFPSAPSVDIAFGNAMHETMEWMQLQANIDAQPTAKEAVKYFGTRIELQPLTSEQIALQQLRGATALPVFLADSQTHFTKGDKAEYNFRNEGVVLPEAVRLGGKIDLLSIDNSAKTITVVDYKTGTPGKDPAKLHRYELQLYCYKLLIEHSHSFKDYRVEEGCLVFVEPDADGKIVRHTVKFDSAKTDQTTRLITAVWWRIQALDLPDISKYGTSHTEIRKFEQDLIDEL